jgi:transposase
VTRWVLIDLNPVYRRLLKMVLEELQGIEQQIGQLDQEMASLLRPYQDAVQRLAEVPGFGVNSAQQILAEIGPPPAPRATAICGGFSIGKWWRWDTLGLGVGSHQRLRRARSAGRQPAVDGRIEAWQAQE